MKYLRLMAGAFVGVGALVFIVKGEYAVAAGLLGSMLGFFIGEHNGARAASKDESEG